MAPPEAASLGKLRTDLGERSLYDAVSQCSRCGFCEQACPTYVATGREAWSGRGRNQAVRMLLEGKFADRGAAAEALSTCLLCGACTTVCPAHVPTADIVLEGRRLIRGEIPRPVRLILSLLEERPALFAAFLKAAYLFKPFARFLGLGEAAGHVPDPPRKFLGELLREDPGLGDSASAAWLYFAACGPNYVLPRVGLATIRVLRAGFGRGAYLDNSCCGLLSYNYGDLESARRLARANIERFERAAAAPVVADCSSCAAHLKSYPQLFMDEPAWKKRSEAFAARVRDVLELLPDMRAARSCAPPATYHDACRARNGQGLCAQPRAAMRAACSDYRELPDADVCCGGAGAFAFVHPDLSEELLKKKVGHIASTQARTVAASSTSCLLQLARGLKKYYPEARVVHLSELVAENLDG